jgi:hypothetical protein
MAVSCFIDHVQPSGGFTGDLLAEKEEHAGGTVGLLDT